MFYSWDVLEFGHSGVGTFWALGTFCSWDVLGLGRFIGGILCSGTFCIWDVCRLGRCLGTFCRSTIFVMCMYMSAQGCLLLPHLHTNHQASA
jgi:hypothetical protein